MFYPGYLITCGSAPAAINSFVVEEHGNLQTWKSVVISKHLPGWCINCHCIRICINCRCIYSRGASIAVAFAFASIAVATLHVGWFLAPRWCGSHRPGCSGWRLGGEGLTPLKWLGSAGWWCFDYVCCTFLCNICNILIFVNYICWIFDSQMETGWSSKYNKY